MVKLTNVTIVNVEDFIEFNSKDPRLIEHLVTWLRRSLSASYHARAIVFPIPCVRAFALIIQYVE
jgi:hypothetical protein